MQYTHISALVAILLGACAAEAAGIPEVPGFDPGKADVSDRVSFLGAIDFGESRDGEFVDDFQFDAYSFRALAGARIDAQVTRAGSASALDDVLYLYGPGDSDRGFEGAARLVADNDSGWGSHARIEDFAVPADGDYLLIVGTADTTGRGAYRVELGCLVASCAPSVPTGDICDAQIVEEMTTCIENIGTHRSQLSDAFEACASDSALGTLYVDSCEGTPAPPAFCALPAADFAATTVPSCRAEVGMPYGLSAGPKNVVAQAAFRDWAASASVEDIVDERIAFDGTNGLRWVSWLTASDTLEESLERSPTARELMDIDPSWSEHLEYNDAGGTSVAEMFWQTGDLFEVWADGEVIGYVGINFADVDYYGPRDPDPVSVQFSVVVALDLDESGVREWTGIY